MLVVRRRGGSRSVMNQLTLTAPTAPNRAVTAPAELPANRATAPPPYRAARWRADGRVAQL